MANKLIRLNELLSGDTFIERGDGQRRILGPVSHVQGWGGTWVSVYFQSGGEFAPGRDVHGFAQVELVHRDADCGHGVHPDLCEEGCWVF